MAKFGIPALIVALLTAAAILLLGNTKTLKQTYALSDEALSNPFMGYAPHAESILSEDPSLTLAYAELLWSEIEPEEGVFAWEQWEASKHFSELRERGIHVILRVICDLPGSEAHRDIPDWLYQKTGDGVDYSISYGKGYCPNYANETLIRAHEALIRALGERYGSDPLIAYIELGSLGHWGEWHVDYQRGLPRIPSEEIRERYVTPYLAAFPNTAILMRRPFTHAQDHGLGLYNDMAGDKHATREWLDWIKRGSSYDQARETNSVVPMPDAWKTAPVGGELTSGIDMEDLIGDRLEDTRWLVEQSHTTFLGPKIPRPADGEEGYRKLLKSLGYRLCISTCRVKEFFGNDTVELTLENHGFAPLYQPLPAYLYVEDPDGTVCAKAELSVDLRTLLPGKKIKIRTKLPGKKLISALKNGQKRLTFGIVDPMTGKDSVRLGICAETKNGRTILF